MTKFRCDNQFQRLIIVSLLLHVTTLLLFAYLSKPAAQQPTPVYIELGLVALKPAMATETTVSKPTAVLHTAPKPLRTISPVAVAKLPTKPAIINQTTTKVALRPIATAAKEAEKADQSDYLSRLDRLQKSNNERHVAEALSKLAATKSKATSSRTPTGTNGNQAAALPGQYGDYLRTLLDGAFARTIRASSTGSLVTVAITIAADGSVLSSTVITSSGNNRYDNSALDAVALINGQLKPPPGGRPYQSIITFKPSATK